MAKFENSVYSKIWDSSEGRQIVTSILNDPNLIRANHTFWREKFLVDPMITPTNAEGEAVFTSRLRQLESGVLMDMRAPLGVTHNCAKLVTFSLALGSKSFGIGLLKSSKS